MGIQNRSGSRPFDSKDRRIIEQYFAQARRSFARIAAQAGLEIFRNHVPIDTEHLKDSIKTRVNGEIAIIEVPNVQLDYGGKRKINAKALATILEIGIGKAGSILHRTQTNQAPGTEKGSPTADWFQHAVVATRAHMKPIGEKLIQQAAQKAIQKLIHG